MLKPGTYTAVATGEWSPGTTPTTGTQYIRVYFRITEGEFKDELIGWTGWLSEKAQERTCESLMVAGWSGADFTNLPGLGSKPVELVVELEDGTDGKQRANVKWVNEPGRVRQNADPQALVGFADRMQALAMGIKNKKPQQNSAAPNGPAPGKLPF